MNRSSKADSKVPGDQEAVGVVDLDRSCRQAGTAWVHLLCWQAPSVSRPPPVLWKVCDDCRYASMIVVAERE
jgi:hypothetical protein